MAMTFWILGIFTEIDLSLLPLWILSTTVSVGLALGLTMYNQRRETRLRRRHEEFFILQIKNNLKRMEQYFLSVEMETTRGEEFEPSTDDMMRSLKTYYIRHEQEMKDVLYQTKLYLPFWTSLTTDDKKMIEGVLDMFAWLLYEYYQPMLPESLCENKVLASRQDLFDNKKRAISDVDRILSVHNS